MHLVEFHQQYSSAATEFRGPRALLLLTVLAVGCGCVVGLQDPCLRQQFQGAWKGEEDHYTWFAHDHPCQVSDFINVSRSSNFSVLYFGDSTDRFQLHDVCHYLRNKGLNPRLEQQLLPEGTATEHEEHFGFDSLISCSWSTGYIHWGGLIPGAWPSGEYFNPGEHSSTPARVRITNTRERFLERWGRPPDILVLNINFWDVHRFSHDGCRVTNEETLQDWNGHFRDILLHLNQVFPETKVKIYHTSARAPHFPQPVVMELNNAGSWLAFQEGWNVADLSSMAQFFEHTQSYLRDTRHPKSFMLLSLFNLYLSTAARLVPSALNA